MSTQWKSWGHYYENAGTQDYFEDHVRIHGPFLNRLMSEGPAKALEAGCGSGIMSVYLSQKGVDVTAMDRDERVLELAAQSAANLGGRVDFKPGDLFDLPFEDGSFDLAFSQGVLEHFDDDQIRQIAREQLRVAHVMWFSVPAKHYNHKDFGDERLLTDSQWRGILEAEGDVRTEYYFYERMKRNFLIKRPLMLMVRLSRREDR